ncbi:MAG: ABC transporter permease subunit [Planctomycetota bacterium]|nr:MAG: ABC transporter permease subunit [Planctomycetota bacterium]
MLPVGAIIGMVLTARGAALIRKRSAAEQSHVAEVVIAIGQPIAMLAFTVVFAAVLASVLTSVGLDARDSIFGRFTPRNSLIVGVIMGFAIIPIIYSISEDALASVPNNLRAASLGSGASPWQTAIKVVLPVAASGIFSASMIGLGRAVGETMIVLMATGNTPTMDLNIFEGFRTLSANIAVELPEAPKGEALYRVLFLCGLVLFIMTFFINTTAEIVRQHYRKKNALL